MTMFLEIKCTSGIQAMQKKYKFLWRLRAERNYKAPAVASLTGILLIIYGFYDRSASFRGVNIFVSAGISLVFLVCYMVYGLLSSKKQYFSEADKQIQLARDYNYTIKLSDEEYYYADAACSIGIQWHMLSGFYTTPDYICILMAGNSNLSLTISKNELTETDTDQVLKMLRAKLPEIRPSVFGNK